MLSSPLLIGLMVFAALGACMTMLYSVFFAERKSIDARLADTALRVRRADDLLQGTDTQSDHSIGRILVRWVAHRVPSSKNDDGQGGKFRQTLCHGGFYSPAALRIFQVCRLGCIILFGAAGLIGGLAANGSTITSILYMIAGSIAGKVVPVFFIGKRARTRQGKIRRELADVLDLLVICLDSGLGIYQAIKIVGREAQEQGRELGKELSQISGEINAGVSLGQALRAMAERTGVDDARSLAAVLIQSERLGSQMAPALRASSDTQRTKRRLRAEEAAQKSTVKMLLPLVMFVLPAMMAVILGPALVQIFHNFRH